MDNHKGQVVHINLWAMIAAIVAPLIAFAFGYGILTQQVAQNRAVATQAQNTAIVNQTIILDKLDTVNSRLTRVETLLQAIK
jgi:hypothetical protein